MYNSKANYVALMNYGENTHGYNTRANHLDDDLTFCSKCIKISDLLQNETSDQLVTYCNTPKFFANKYELKSESVIEIKKCRGMRMQLNPLI
ncbi:hypothetical protein BpHYR1_035984 [Brachionus plicatilis]|uniref:Uncharacterized protein n=1 Tax=Brachionus plicatilis TaxID=10195 RepID=A0A3M7QQQ1_BRAPC|nr:hypothetical protein BpHYR1_035984 [Brachionus plicatilis]